MALLKTGKFHQMNQPLDIFRKRAAQGFPGKWAGERFMRGDMKFLLPYGLQRHRPCWKPYWKNDITHGICCAHLLRELQGVQENQSNQLWPQHFSALLMDMKRRKEGALGAGRHCLEPDVLAGISSSYDAYIRLALSGKPRAGKGARKTRKAQARQASGADRPPAGLQGVRMPVCR